MLCRISRLMGAPFSHSRQGALNSRDTDSIEFANHHRETLAMSLKEVRYGHDSGAS
jgi:hypothetical protein